MAGIQNGILKTRSAWYSLLFCTTTAERGGIQSRRELSYINSGLTASTRDGTILRTEILPRAGNPVEAVFGIGSVTGNMAVQKMR